MKICYFGIYDPNFGRNKVYISGLKENGHEIIECRDISPGILKFWRLWRKHRKMVYDVMIVGYPGHIVVPFAKLISKGPVIFDALATLYEGEVLSRGRYRRNPLMLLWIHVTDYLAVKSADLILVETNAQKDFFIKRFSLKQNKIVRVFTGADEKVYFRDQSVLKQPQFTVVFRGKFLPEAGVEYILEAAKILETQNVKFLIIGNGFLEKKIKAKIDELKLLISQYLPSNELREKMLRCHVSLGQFGKHERLERTIPHKAFEALSLGLPYITGRAQGISELLTSGKDCLMVNCADGDDLADKILILKNNQELLENISGNGHRLFQEKLTSKKLGKDIIEAVNILQ